MKNRVKNIPGKSNGMCEGLKAKGSRTDFKPERKPVWQMPDHTGQPRPQGGLWGTWLYNREFVLGKRHEIHGGSNLYFKKISCDLVYGKWCCEK